MSNNLTSKYQLAKKQLHSLLDNDNYEISNDANIAAFLNQLIDQINWVGFYYLKDDKLILGPFQGLVACSILPKDKGVCWKAVNQKKTIYVANVHEVADHIACDSASNSELVFPIFKDGKVIKVLDIDSPIIDRFNQEEIKLLEDIVEEIK